MEIERGETEKGRENRKQEEHKVKIMLEKRKRDQRLRLCHGQYQTNTQRKKKE